MEMQQKLSQVQKLVLTQSMQQSLKILQMPVLEVREYLEEQALSNPLLTVDDSHAQPLNAEVVAEERYDSDEFPPLSRRHTANTPEETPDDFTACASRQESFSEYLEGQIGQMQLLDANMRSLCLYLIGCLNSAGYLDCPLAELAEDLHTDTFEIEQALYVVQALDPPGVGARNLSECLLLQLAQGHEFTEVNIRMIREGLELLAQKDLSALEEKFHLGRAEIERAARTVQSLNPIPSRGFSTGGMVQYAVPEASIRAENGQIVVEMDERLLPKVSLMPEYCAMLGNPDFQEAQTYLKEKSGEANSLIANLKNRNQTMYAVLMAVAERQREPLLTGSPLRAMTMRELAEKLELNISTISRTVKEKYVQFGGKTVPLRSLFVTALSAAPDGQSVSADRAKQQLRRFIAAEDAAHPLSDDALSEALGGVGIKISRRTVAKYREELGIPSTRQRKKDK